MEVENERFSVACLRCRQNLKFGDFTSLLCRGPDNLLANIRATRAARLFNALLTNDITVLWRCRSRSLHRFPNIWYTDCNYYTEKQVNCTNGKSNFCTFLVFFKIIAFNVNTYGTFSRDVITTMLVDKNH